MQMILVRRANGGEALVSSWWTSKCSSIISFHSRTKTNHGDSSIDLISHKDWLSQPQVIKLFQNLRDPSLILPLFSQLSSRKDYKPNESLYTTLVNKLAGAKDYDGIEALVQRIRSERKCRLSDVFFRNLIKIYGHSAGRINRAIETLSDMPNFKCWPSAVTFNFVLNLLVSSKQFEVVHEVYVKGFELGVEIDACSLNIIIKGLCARGQIEAARKVLDEFTKHKCRPNKRTFSTIMHGLCELGRVEEAFGFLDKMEAEGVELDAVAFNVLIRGLRKLGKFDEGVEVLEKSMVVRGCEPNEATYQEVLYCLLDAKRFLEAKAFVCKALQRRVMTPSFDSFKTMIEGFCGENLVEEMEWALGRMVGCGFVPKMGTWKRIVRCVVSKEQKIEHVDFDTFF